MRLTDDRSRVTLTVCSPRIVRVELAGDDEAAATSYVGERTWPRCPFEIVAGDPVRITTADLGVEAGAEPLRLAFLGPDGGWLLREPSDGGMRSEPVAGKYLTPEESFALKAYMRQAALATRPSEAK